MTYKQARQVVDRIPIEHVEHTLATLLVELYAIERLVQRQTELINRQTELISNIINQL